MSGLVQAMALLKATFDKYAGKEGSKETLTKAELAELLRVELTGGSSSSKADQENFFKMLDNDGDGVVDFTEYVTFVASLTVILNEK